MWKCTSFLHLASDAMEDELASPWFAVALDKWWDTIGFSDDPRSVWAA